MNIVEMLKQLYTVRSLSLGWSVFWRSFLIMLAHMIVLGIISALLQNLAIINAIISVIILLINIAALGWAAQRIKTKL